MLWKFGPFDECLYIFSARVGFPKYQDVRTEEGADLEGVSLSKAECRLIEVYVDTINTIFYWNLDGFIAYNEICQMRWQILVIHSDLR